MRFHWIRDRIRQGQFNVKWKPGVDNLADFFTKLHPPKYHRETRHLYVSDPTRNQLIRQHSVPHDKIASNNEIWKPEQDMQNAGEGVLMIPSITSSAAAATHNAAHQQRAPVVVGNGRKTCNTQITHSYNMYTELSN